MLYLSLIRLQLRVARLRIPNSARGESTLWLGDVYEHSARPIRTNARWLVRAFVHFPAHDSRPWHTAPVSDQRCWEASVAPRSQKLLKALTIAVQANVKQSAVPF
jgi:hypothetical protein